MDKQVYGQGHGRIIPDELIATKVSNSVYERQINEVIAPNIALANADFEGDLVCGNKVTWIRRDTIQEDLFQDVQGNEEPEVDTIELCSDEAEICGQKKFQIKLSVDQLKRLQCEDLDGVYLDTVHKTIENTLDQIWNDHVFATMIMMACASNTGNCAMDMANLGSPDNPVIISNDATESAVALEKLYYDLYLTLSANNAMTTGGAVALILPTLAAVRSMPIFAELNTCCGDDNVKVHGNLSNTILGFDAFQSNSNVLRTTYNGRTIYYVIAAVKEATGFVSDMYNFKWWEGKQDWFLVGTEVHGAYVTQPEQIAIACIAFE